MNDTDPRIEAALAIHAPCHTDTTQPYGCTHGHFGDTANGHPDPTEKPSCTNCVDSYEEPVTYPCPTAAALGVTEGVTP